MRLLVRQIQTILWVLLFQVAGTVSAADVNVAKLSQVEEKVSHALEEAGAGENLRAHIIGRTDELLYQSPRPFSVESRNLKFYPEAMRFQTELYFIAEDEKPDVLEVMEVRGRYDSIVRVPTVIHRLRSDDVISLADLEWTEIPAQKMRRGTVTSQEALIGQSPRRVLSPGRPINEDDVRATPVIHKDDIVTVRYQTPMMDLSVTAEALEEGAVGETIAVRNTESKKTLRAKVYGPGEVRVEGVGP